MVCHFGTTYTIITYKLNNNQPEVKMEILNFQGHKIREVSNIDHHPFFKCMCGLFKSWLTSANMFVLEHFCKPRKNHSITSYRFCNEYSSYHILSRCSAKAALILHDEYSAVELSL